MAALKAIAPFISRGDRSDNNIEELRPWRAAGLTSEALTPEKWYHAIGGGIAQALDTAGTMNAYTLADRAIWLSWLSVKKGSLVVVIEGDPKAEVSYFQFPV